MRLFKNILLVTLSVLAVNAHAGDKIKYYFNHPVDNSVSTGGVNAINLNGLIDDTLIAYINRANYTLDIAVYNFTSTTSASMANVANAINAAYARGVKIRWIYDGSSTNSGLSLLNTAIPTLASPTTGSFTIMHNKFMVVDGNSPNPDQSVVWTGSTNWSIAQFENDYDNVVIFQDSALAHAYIGEFNMMWGDTGLAPNLTNSKFGHLKTDLGRHNFTIEGKHVELYFSPSDGTNTHILSAISTANKDLYFGMYTFTFGADATALVNAKNSGVYVAGVLDNYSTYVTGNQYTTLNSGLTSGNLMVYSGSYLYHNKYMIVDPSDACSDPLVLTGSHNWSNSANTDNDENTVIIHDDTAANIYYQSFRADFASLGGTLVIQNGCHLAVDNVKKDISDIVISPNPSNGNFNIAYQLNTQQKVSVYITDVLGKSHCLFQDEAQNKGSFNRVFSVPLPGIYMIKVIAGDSVYNYKLINQ